MPEITDLLKHWWKQMLVVVILALVAVGVIVFMKPKQYLSTATAVPASAYASDKSKIFNDNIQELYTALGTPDDLDMIVGTAQLDTIYEAVSNMFNLQDHYKMGEKGDAAVSKAASLLRSNSKVMKSEYGELKVKVWDTDKHLAGQLANALMDELQSIHQYLQSVGNRSILEAIKNKKQQAASQLDSLAKIKAEWTADAIKQQQLLADQSQQYDKLAAQYQLIVDSKPPALIIVERAKASNWPDKPKRMQILVATAVLSLLFALLLAIVLERRNAA